MSADPIVYCLERLTDYAKFERLATDLMAGTHFAGIEPLGGSGDGGRDALHVHREAGTVRVFAYSVRHDWEATTPAGLQTDRGGEAPGRRGGVRVDKSDDRAEEGAPPVKFCSVQE